MWNNLKQFINKTSLKLLWLFIFLYISFFSLISFWKYFNFLYNGIDLAIFNQVFWNSVDGRLLDFSIHPHSYLGDHFTPFIFLLLPLYALFRSPLILLFLQSFFLGISAWPIYLITKNAFKNYKDKFLIAFLMAFFFLINPIIWNINLFEFHILPFAIFFLLFAFYFYQKRKFVYFLLFLLLALSVREDVSLAVFMFGFLPFFSLSFSLFSLRFPCFSSSFWSRIAVRDKLRRESGISPRHGDLALAGEAIRTITARATGLFRHFTRNDRIKYIFVPIILSTIWFFVSNKIISSFNPDNAYKFLVYYQWIGESNNLQELLLNILAHPIKIILHLLSFANLAVIFIFFLSFVFLPVFSKRYLLLALGPVAQIFLSESVSGIIYSTHYASLFIPALVISSIYGFKRFLEIRRKKNKEPSAIARNELVSLVAASGTSEMTRQPHSLRQEYCHCEEMLSEAKATTKQSRGLQKEHCYSQCRRGGNPFNILRLNIKEVYSNLIKDKYFLIIILIITIIYANLVIGPTIAFFTEIGNIQIKNRKNIYEQMIDKIPHNASVVASYNLLPNLSSRKELYSLHYGFFGKRQFSEKDYIFPNDIDYYLIDFSDLITYQLHSQNSDYKKKQYKTGDLRLREYLKNYGVADVIDSVVLFKKDHKSDIKLVEILDNQNVIASETLKTIVIAKTSISGSSTSTREVELPSKIMLLRYEQNKKNLPLDRKKSVGSAILNYSFYWQLQNVIARNERNEVERLTKQSRSLQSETIGLGKNYQFQLEILNKDGRQVWQKIYPLAYGIYPTSRWQEGQVIKTNYWFLIPNKFLNKKNELFISLVHPAGYVGLNKLRSVVDVIEEKRFLGDKIKLYFY